MKKVFEGLESIESSLNIVYAILEGCGDQIALIRTTGSELLTFSDDLCEKVKTAVAEHFAVSAVAEHFAVDHEHCSVTPLSFDSDTGVYSMLVDFNDEGGNVLYIPVTLSHSVLY